MGAPECANSMAVSGFSYRKALLVQEPTSVMFGINKLRNEPPHLVGPSLGGCG